MNLTIERTLDAATIGTFYQLYVTAFDPLRTRAAARHMLTVEEFAEEMTDERIEKYVVRDEAGTPVAMTTVTADLTAVAWISPEYYAARYPDHAARAAVFYLGYTLVHPEHANQGIFTLMTDRLAERFTAARGVCVFDVCAYNDARTVGRFVATLSRTGEARVDALDVQTYYAASFGTAELVGAA